MYAVASRTYASYSFNMASMYGTILNLGAAATVYDAIAKPIKRDSSKEPDLLKVEEFYSA